MVARILDRIEQRLMRALAAGGSPVERLDRWIDVIVDLFAEHPHARPAAPALALRGRRADRRAAERATSQRHDSTHRRRRRGAAAAKAWQAGVFRPASVPHTLQTLIGATVYHFASGEFGDEMIGRPMFSATEVRRRKDEVKGLIHRGLVA